MKSSVCMSVCDEVYNRPIVALIGAGCMELNVVGYTVVFLPGYILFTSSLAVGLGCLDLWIVIILIGTMPNIVGIF